LLHIAGLTLERLIAWATINQHFTRYDTHGHTSREHVQKCRLTSTGDTLLTRLAMSTFGTALVVVVSYIP
jgi:hypothetical protein